MSLRINNRRWSVALVATATVASMVLALPAPSQAAPSTATYFTTNAGIYPTFDPAVTDYVVRCNDAPVMVNGLAAPGTEVEVNGVGNFKGAFNTVVPLHTNASFSVTTIDLSGGGNSSSYYVRCLPNDFPNFTSSPSQNPQAEYYMALDVTPSLLGPTPAPEQYMTLFDDDGVPVWWRAINDKSIYATYLPDGNAAEVSLISKAGEEYSLGGATSRIDAPLDGSGADMHELQQLPNGDYLIASLAPKAGQDLTFMGGPSNATVEDAVVKEIAPDGTVVWSWDTWSHVPVTEADPSWWSTDLSSTNGPLGYDIYHFNSAAESGNNVLISYRQLNAVFMVDKTTGNIIWKLGGTHTDQSLTVVGDPLAPNVLAGQHDARFAPGGGISIHDDGTILVPPGSRAPRAVLYQVDPTAMTATLAQSVSDPLVTSSFCCGSARKLAGGDWVMGWGFNNVITEINPAAPVTSAQYRPFLVRWTDPGLFNYRVEPVMPGVLSRQQLRANMNVYSQIIF